MTKIIAWMVDEHGIRQRVHDGAVPGKRTEIRGKVEKLLREKLVGSRWNWDTLVVEFALTGKLGKVGKLSKAEERKERRNSQRIFERRILNQNHASFPCGYRTAYYAHSGGDGTALKSRGSGKPRCHKDLNLLYDIFEKVLGFRPERQGNVSATFTQSQLSALMKITGFDAWFLKNWLQYPKSTDGIIQRNEAFLPTPTSAATPVPPLL